jgi:hypothetical protein
MKNIFKAPENITVRDRDCVSVFLAGSIEMGKAENWQTKATEFFTTEKRSCYNILNPRRDDWDSSWTQDFSNPQFYQQVSWELDALDKADLIMMYFDPSTKSPISLLELGLYATSKKLVVICPDGFWRKGNVEVVCNKYDIPLYHSLEEYFEDGRDK